MRCKTKDRYDDLASTEEFYWIITMSSDPPYEYEMGLKAILSYPYQSLCCCLSTSQTAFIQFSLISHHELSNKWIERLKLSWSLPSKWILNGSPQRPYDRLSFISVDRVSSSFLFRSSTRPCLVALVPLPHRMGCLAFTKMEQLQCDSFLQPSRVSVPRRNSCLIRGASA